MNSHVQPAVVAATAGPPTRRRIAPWCLALLLLAAGCGGGSDTTSTAGGATSSSTAGGATSAHTASPTAPSTAPSTAPPTRQAGTVEVTVTVKDGKVTPPTHRVKVTKGQTVRLLVTSDVADEVHVHGVDLKTDVAAGRQATIEFLADQAGLDEVELEQKGLQLVQLEVR